RSLSLVIVVALAGAAHAQDVTAGLRAGYYTDSDRTEIYRTFAGAGATLGRWHVAAQEAIDVLTSAPVGVRSAPPVDATTGASRLSMSDERYETSVSAAYSDGAGKTIGVSAVDATEHDYVSIGAGLNASIDVADRDATLIASFHFDHNDITSVADP